MALQPAQVEQYRSYWDELKEKKKSAEEGAVLLTTELLKQLEQLSIAYETEKLDRERDVAYTRQMQRKNRELELAMAEIQKKVDRDASILVLIDGDGLLFEDSYVQAGESGGIEAAQELFSRVTLYVRRSCPDVPSDIRVLVRVYANIQGLAKAYSDAGVADSYTTMSFARGFTKAKANFDFVDCGSGKERADTKIAASFNLYVHNIQTRHIILGCSHDNGYARLLEELPSEDYGKVTLLEGIPFVRELSILTSRFSTTKFDGLFRSNKIDPGSKIIDMKQRIPNGNAISPPPGFSLASLNLKSPSPAISNNSAFQAPHEPPGRPASTSTTDSGPVRTLPSSGTAPLSSSSQSGGLSSWAGKAMTAASLPQTSSVQEHNGNVGVASTIKRNRKGQRIDAPKHKDLEQDTITKVQNMKLCNNFYLKGACHNANSSCEHDHYYKPNKMEFEALKFIARRIACVRGSSCDDPKCTAGHRCPWMVNGMCRYKDAHTCRFSDDLHHNDITEAKTITVR